MVRGRESKRERRAEYSAAVSRLADSGCSCSECTMRGRQCAQETAVKRAKKKKRGQVHVSEKAHECMLFFVGLCCVSVQECKHSCVCVCLCV